MFRFKSENERDTNWNSNYAEPHLSTLENNLEEVQNVNYNINPGMDGKIWVYYNVTSTDNATTLINNTTGLTSTMLVDGISCTTTKTYTFNTTGEHLVQFGINGTALKGTFYGTTIDRIYLPSNLVVTSGKANAIFYNCSLKKYCKAIGPISENPFGGSIGAINNNAQIEINGLTNWTTTDFNTNGVKEYVVKGTFNTIPSGGFCGFNYTNDYKYIWVESPNLTTINGNNFKNLQFIKIIVINVSIPPTMSGSGQFTSINNTFKLFVPYSSNHSILDAYKEADTFSTFSTRIYELNPDGTIPMDVWNNYING